MKNTHTTNTSKITLYLLHLIVLFFLTTTTSLSQEQPHIVKSLPGYPGDLPFTLETGYIGVGELEQVQLFYYFVESERDVGTDPLLIWLTGGPGCSVLSGLTFETGPLVFNLTESSLESKIPKLQQNPNSWTKVASIIFVDSPVGTGFSYATHNEASKSNDTLQAAHIYDFLRKWISKHPKFMNNPFYVAGDSYSGITIPIIVQNIIQGNEIGLSPELNLKGYVIGNPVSERDADANEKYKFAQRVSLLSDELYQSAVISCNGDFVNVDANNTKCLRYLQVMEQDIKSINGGQVLEHRCQYMSPKPVKKLSLHKYSKRYALLEKGKGCRDYYLLTYSWANDDQVREALHIREGSIGRWVRCNFSIPYETNVQFSLEYHKNISTKPLHVLIFSGDQDMGVSYLETLKWINELQIPTSDDWRPWFVDGQVAGYVTEFSISSSSPYQLAFTTIKGGGHTAAEYKPRECRAMIERWLSLSPL
ncbi:serine carboxypeptidase-like 7 [Silene latifolia]|uniref:serine carboxypeptidase-like 7 n=1 Tax=Silene latifolia TaxID=37657 RepID=UPI003D770286